jgi:hypothetical protein
MRKIPELPRFQFDDIAFDVKTLLSFPVLIHFLLLDLEHFHLRRLSTHLDLKKLNGCTIDSRLCKLSETFTRLSVHLYDNYSCAVYHKFTVADLCLGTEQVASKLLREFEARVTSRRLQSTQKAELHQLFIGILVAMVAAKYCSCELISRWKTHALILT